MPKVIEIVISVILLSMTLSAHSFAQESKIIDKPKEKLMPSSLTVEQLDDVLTRKFTQGHYSSKGADTCLKCHDIDSKKSAIGIFNNVHGKADIKASPFAQLQCESCHGPLGKHGKKVRKGKLREPMITFGLQSLVTADKQNSVCLSCHANRPLLAWQGSSHQNEQVPCASCHQMHKQQETDPILVKQQQNKLCGRCHQEQLRASNQRSSHPLKGGQMACSDCHNAHGSFNEHELSRESTNQTCNQCHSEKRGPLLWEHAPVTEDCAICHDAHGSINANLLKQRTPQLCRDCHIPADHPSPMQSSDHVTTNFKSAFLFGKNCLNCHSLVHGSNHPSGQTFQR